MFCGAYIAVAIHIVAVEIAGIGDLAISTDAQSVAQHVMLHTVRGIHLRLYGHGGDASHKPE